jgi:glycolate oxidase FAD binding subunit
VIDYFGELVLSDALQQFQETIRSAAANKTPLRIRGSGSKDFYGVSLEGDVLDTRGYSGIVEYEPTELVFTARAGTPLREVEAALAEKGQMLPFEPPRSAVALRPACRGRAGPISERRAISC